MAAEFSAELYLRLVGEEALLTSGPAGRDSSLPEAAAALVAVGALTRATAAQVLVQYQQAVSLRSGNGRGRWWTPSPSTSTSPVVLTAPRVVVCEQDLPQPWGRLHVRYVVLDGGQTVLAVAGAESGHAGGVGGHAMTTGIQVTLEDDSGSVQAAHFSGQSRPGAWEGRLTAERPLSASTRWIVIDGERLELRDSDRVRPAVHVERLPESNPAARYLWLRLASSGHWHHRRPPESIEAAIAALVAAGELDADGPLVDEVRAVIDALRDGGTPSRPLPPEWASVVRRAAPARVATGTAAIAVVTPPFDGIVVSVEALTASDNGFELQVAVSPGISSGLHRPQLDGPRVAWWAEDDRGNHYLGVPGSWHSSEERSAGVVIYQPGLDARAKELRLAPTSDTERAVITLTDLPAVPPR